MDRLSLAQVSQVAVQLLQRAAAPLNPRFHPALKPLVGIELDLAEQLQLVLTAPLDEPDRSLQVLDVHGATAVRRGLDY